MKYNTDMTGRNLRYLTHTGDVIELLNCNSGVHRRSYSLCKVLMHSLPNSIEEENWVYMLFIDGDDYPVVISEEYAMDILKYPSEGERLAYSCWMSRYR